MTHKLNNGYMAVEVAETVVVPPELPNGLCFFGDGNLPVAILMRENVLCKASEATEEQAREVVHVEYGKYRDYEYVCYYHFKNALNSLHSFCRSIGKKPEEVLIIKTCLK